MTIIATEKRDAAGRLTYRKFIHGLEQWRERDDQGLVHFRDSTGFEYWFKEDERGNRTYCRGKTGAEWWREYDKNDNITHFRNSTGVEYWYEYDEMGYDTHYWHVNGDEWWSAAYDVYQCCIWNADRIEIGCKLRTRAEWDFFFSDECDEVFETLRDTDRFEMIKADYELAIASWIAQTQGKAEAAASVKQER
jgi:hypothetical protein